MPHDTRQRLLDAALRCFTARGLHATTTAEVSREAGVSPGTLFHYFTTKDAVLEGARLEATTRLTQGVRAGPVAPGETVHGVLRRLWVDLARQAGADRPALSFWVAYWFTPGVKRPRQVVPFEPMRHMDQLLAHTLQAPEEAGRALLTLWYWHWGAAVQWAQRPSHLGATEAVARAYEAWWALVGLPRELPFPTAFEPVRGEQAAGTPAAE